MLLLGGFKIQGALSLGESEKHFDNALKSLKQKSPAAVGILQFVEGHAEKIAVMCLERDGMFGATCLELGQLAPVIVWNPTKKFKVRGAVVTGYRAFNNSPIYSSKEITEYPAEIVLIHEIGHAKQYLENPDWFNREQGGDQIQPGTRTVKQIEEDNLERHERPVAADFGLKLRQNYEDYLGFA